MASKNDSILVNQLYLPIRDALSKKSTSQKYIHLVDNFRDKNVNKLRKNIPSERLSYPMSEIYRIIGISNSDVIRAIKNAHFSSSRGDTVKSPNLMTLALILRSYIERNDKKGTRAALEMYTIATYTHLFSKYYNKYLPNEEVMEYTLSRLSSKFYFKKYNTVEDAIMATSETNLESNRESLLANNDEDIADFLTAHYSRLNNQMRKFANEYNIDLADGNTLRKTQEEGSSSDGGSYKKGPESLSANVSQTIINVNRSLAQGIVDKRIVRVSSSNAKVESDVLERTLKEILDNDQSRVQSLISDLVLAYTNNGGDATKIHSKEFLGTMLILYKKNNIVQEEFKRFRSTLEYFRETYGEKYSVSSRNSAKAAYKKALYTYFVLIIMSTTR